jgi:hypothetical protein
LDKNISKLVESQLHAIPFRPGRLDGWPEGSGEGSGEERESKKGIRNEIEKRFALR